MGLPDAMAALAEEWDDVQRRLGSRQASRLRELTAQFVAERDSVASANIAERVMDLLIEELPLDHPVLRALAATQERFRSPAADRAWFQLADALRERLEGTWPGTPVEDHSDEDATGSPGVPFDQPDDDE
jgi:hypothetical protein